MPAQSCRWPRHRHPLIWAKALQILAKVPVSSSAAAAGFLVSPLEAMATTVDPWNE